MARLFDKDNKDSMIILSIVVLFVVSVSLAIFLSNVKLENAVEGTIAIVLNEGPLVINYTDGNEIEINDSKEHTYGITLSNTSESRLFYSVKISNSNVKNANIKIKNSEGQVVNEVTENITNQKLINLYSLDAGATIRYSITIQNKNRARSTFTLKVENDSLSTETFSDLILFHNNVNVPKTRLGVEAATTDEGLLTTIDNRGTSYYFRGNINYNYVKLGEYLFRIVRINGDNSVRLVLDTVLTDPLPYNTNSLAENAEVTSLAVLGNASIKTYLEEWVTKNLTSIKNYLSVSDFCTDINFNSVVSNIRYSSAYERIYNDAAPDLFCSSSIYQGTAGLLSADEVVLAGGIVGVSNDKYYLYNKDIPGNYVTSSTYFINTSDNIAMINIMSNGALGDGILITNQSYIRPVININESAKVKGTGTIEDPYIIVS